MNLINLKKALDMLDALEQAEAKYLEAHQIMDELHNKCPNSFKPTNSALNTLGVAIDTAITMLNKDCEEFGEE